MRADLPPFLLIVSDGVSIRSIHSPALPPDLAGAIEDFIATRLIERGDTPALPLPPSAPILAFVRDATQSKADIAAQARAQGYTGDTCTKCYGSHMQIAGHCMVCADCGETTGCS